MVGRLAEAPSLAAIRILDGLLGIRSAGFIPQERSPGRVGLEFLGALPRGCILLRTKVRAP